MKTLFLIFTILFSFTIFADCCNFEVNSAATHQELTDLDHKHNDDSQNHTANDHCHCSPINHIKIFSQTKSIVAVNLSLPIEPISSRVDLLKSTFESSIFHPPIG